MRRAELLPERGTMLIKGGSTDADGWVVIAADFHGIAGHPDAAASISMFRALV
jgi:hypothetical protein